MKTNSLNVRLSDDGKQLRSPDDGVGLIRTTTAINPMVPDSATSERADPGLMDVVCLPFPIGKLRPQETDNRSELKNSLRSAS